MTRLAVTAAARADIRDIRRFSEASFGTRVALTYLAGLRSASDMLLGQPGIGRREHDLGDDIRSLSYQSHRIYYAVVRHEVIIIRIFHHARDAGQAFGEPT